MTWDKTWGYRMLEDAPEVWIGYERAFFDIVRHRVTNFIEGILMAHETLMTRRLARQHRRPKPVPAALAVAV
ncbi:hypothetical protein ACFVYR_20310 [Streptomyces sp. NPDC058284]|uniref:hypothetical protein n=1 Tax=unclassified Streptomyces TaxID=2593676 RepID=UPI00365A090B